MFVVAVVKNKKLIVNMNDGSVVAGLQKRV
jgi:hypothetical protein